jgi:hypothetical protein
MSERTASQIGRSNVARGKDTERVVAKRSRDWFPEARRSRDNGSVHTADQGDLAGMADEKIFWSVKADRDGRKPGTMAAWLAEMRAKAGDRISILVQRRDGMADPLRWWAWIWAGDLLALSNQGPPWLAVVAAKGVPIRLEYGDLLIILELAGLTPLRPTQDAVAAASTAPDDRAPLDRMQAEVLDAGLADQLTAAGDRELPDRVLLAAASAELTETLDPTSGEAG